MEAVIQANDSVATDAHDRGPLSALVGIVFRPAATLNALGRAGNSGAWLPAVLMVGVVVLAVYARSRADGYYFFQSQVAYYAQHSEQAAYAPREPVFAPLITTLIRLAEQVGGLLGAWVLWTVGLAVTGLLAGGGEMPWGRALRLVLWSWVPHWVRGVVQTAYMLLSHDPIFNPGLSGLLVDNTPPSLGQYAYVMVPRSTRMWSLVLSHLDIYLVWQLALVLVGVPVFLKIPPKWGRASVLCLAVIWVGLRVWVAVAQHRY